MGQASPSRSTVVMVHGWEQSANSVWVILAKTTHLSTADKNIITLDWSKDAKALGYGHAVNSVPLVGAHLAQRIHQWIVLNLINVTTTRFVGFSLGAQVIGFCGRSTFRRQTDRSTSR
ncbi:lipase member H-like [Photinus pyralis]|uniref:lipase member H-like n=1 Tax=Photinus pyralis TaxID=7054 RepID=UPI0012673809|nr:lipase member H-like [Photinus pyralis]